MNERERDDLLIERAIAELGRLPAVPPATIARVATTAMASGAPDERGEPVVLPGVHRWRRAVAYVGLAAAACAVGYLARGVIQPSHRPAPSYAAAQRAALVPVVDGRDADARPLPRQFLFRSRAAHRVSLVGDFNDWNPRATPLEQAAGSGLWSVTVPVTPGRHSYAFMVDDSVFALDPNAPVLKDPDLGTRASVVVVGRP